VNLRLIDGCHETQVFYRRVKQRCAAASTDEVHTLTAFHASATRELIEYFFKRVATFTFHERSFLSRQHPEHQHD
jgi:hypothetical protein